MFLSSLHEIKYNENLLKKLGQMIKQTISKRFFFLGGGGIGCHGNQEKGVFIGSLARCAKEKIPLFSSES